VAGETEVSIVHQDERTVTFMDIEPAVSGHMIVVPRRHAASLADLDAEERSCSE
jgi:diadenosine tetraphosphate (Ap4A) HIT family hydrolase